MSTLPSRGSITLLVLVFGAVFFVVLSALSGYVLAENRAEDQLRQKSEAFAIAEAGIEYYRWLLAHFPGDTAGGTFSYADPEGGAAGSYTLAVAADTACGVTTALTVRSTGAPAEAPGIASTIVATYAQPSIADYSYILDTNAWFTSTTYGPLHTNGGLRMDGDPNAPVSSSLSTWDCGPSNGCSPEQRRAPGVVGDGSNQSLWEYPTPQVDFAGIAADFAALKSTAQSSGLYFGRVSTGSDTHLGYHLIFNADGTVTVKQVTSVSALSAVPVDGSSGGRFVNDYSLINKEKTLGTYAVPSSCGLIFVEDNAWIEGTVNGKVTLVAADVADTVVDANIVVPDNLAYTATDGSDGLTAIAQNNFLIGPATPDSLTMDGIFVAQGGAFGRNLYDCRYSGYDDKHTLSILGSIVSALRPGTEWVYGDSYCRSGSISGYEDRTTSFDRANAADPPPFTPVTSTQYEFTDWRQVD
ncbi:MAG TPA: hypothetical protein VHC68_00060 [Candidatus Paceibacterota bacterium]|nr:hypothetical protein [Candidatus Paceibacterota bacterium]